MRIEAVPSVEHTGLALRPMDPVDIEPWYAYLSMPHTVEHTNWNVKSADDLRTLVERYNSDDPASDIQFAITEGADRQLLGVIGFHSISPVNRTAEIAYNLHPAHWGFGIASACCKAVVAWGFAARGYVRIQATSLETNAGSIRVIEKCGFVLEGKLRNYRIVRNEPRDFLMYSKLASR